MGYGDLQYFSVILCLFCYVLLCTSHTIGYKRSEHAPNRAPCTHAKRQNLFACNILATKNTFSVIINNLLVQMTWESLGGGRSARERLLQAGTPGTMFLISFLASIHCLLGILVGSFASRLFYLRWNRIIYISCDSLLCVSGGHFSDDDDGQGRLETETCPFNKS